jgi:hypothetical protein
MKTVDEGKIGKRAVNRIPFVVVVARFVQQVQRFDFFRFGLFLPLLEMMIKALKLGGRD